MGQITRTANIYVQTPFLYKTSFIDPHNKNVKSGIVNLVVVHVGIVTMCYTIKFTILFFDVFDA